MARGSTMMQFQIDLSDVDRGVYAQLALATAQHPSEQAAYLVARVLANALEHCDGLAFTGGLAAADEPALWVRDLTGRLQTWIEVGTPEAARLHKASKAADRVAVYCHKDPAPWLRALARERVHAADAVELFALPPAVVDAIAQGVDRRNVWTLSRIDGVVYLQSGADGFEFGVDRLDWPKG